MLDKYYHTKDVYYTREKMTAYLRDELEDYERRAFEKLLSEDPLLKDALEGVAISGLASAEKHFKSIDRKTDILTGVSKPFVLSPMVRNVAVAAMLLVLIGGSYFIVNQLDSASGQQTAKEDIPENTSPSTLDTFDSMALQNQQPVSPESDNPVASEVSIEKDKALQGAVKEETLAAEPIELTAEDVLFEMEETSIQPAAPTVVESADDFEVMTAKRKEKETKKATNERSDYDVLSGTPATQENPNEALAVVEEVPEFPGGEKALFSYLLQNLKYPAQAKDAGIEGTVYIQFVITETGDVINSRVVKGIGGGCDEEALRVVNSMPLWKPGKQNGVPVKVLYSLPVHFKR